MKVAVTGASGFVGRHVLDALLMQGIEVIALTREAQRLADYQNSVQIVEFDIANVSKYTFDEIGRPDVLIHLAWDGLPNYKSLHHFESELPKQYYFLKMLVEKGLKSLFVTGTCFEYGMQSGSLKESFPTLPNNPYGYAKDALRKQLEFLKQKTPINLTWARLFYMYGDNQPKSSIYSQLKDTVSRGDKVFNMSGGEQLRDYLPATKVASYIVEMALLNSNLGIVNFSSGQPISVKSLVEEWVLEHGWDIKLNLGFYPYPDYEPMAFWGDRSRLDEILRDR